MSKSENRSVRNSSTPIIIGCGLIVLDVVYDGGSMQMLGNFAGGTCGNVLTIMSYLGWHSLPVGRFDSDSASRLIFADMKRWRVDQRYLTLSPFAKTPVIVEKIVKGKDGQGHPKYYFDCPCCGAWYPTFQPVRASSIVDSDLCSLEPQVFFMDRVSRSALILAKAYREKNALIIFEPSGVTDERLFMEALELAHIVKYSSDRLRHFNFFDRAQSKFLEIETRSADGLRYRMRGKDREDEHWTSISAVPVQEIKDSAGAGDWCTAGLIQMLGKSGAIGFLSSCETQLAEAFNFGQALAAWNCKFEAPRGGMYVTDPDSLTMEILKTLKKAQIKVQQTTEQRVRSDKIKAICPKCNGKSNTRTNKPASSKEPQRSQHHGVTVKE